MQPTSFNDIHQFSFGPLPEFQSFNPDRLSLWFGGPRDGEIADRYSTTLAEVESAAINAAVLNPEQQIGLVVLSTNSRATFFEGSLEATPSTSERARW